MRSLSTTLLLPLLLSCGKDRADTGAERARYWVATGEVEGTGRALVGLDGGYLAATSAGLFESPDGASWVEVVTSGLPEGDLIFLGAIGPSSVLGFVRGEGLYRSQDSGDTWAPVSGPPTQALMAALNPRGLVTPLDVAVGDDGAIWMAAVGGLFRSDDGGDTWSGVDLSGAGHFNVLFTSVAAEGDQVWAVSQLADSILPGEYAGLLSGTVFASTDGGESWSDLGADYPGAAPMDVAFVDGSPCIAALDAGARCFEGGAWVDRGGPPDAVAVAELEDGSLGVASAWDGVWRYADGDWTQTPERPMIGLLPGLALDTEGVSYALAEVEESGGGASGGHVSIALSFHANYYHSYRGDENSEDGYGKDIRVIETILDWLDAHPGVRADWDIENYFTLDGWMASESPELLARIQERVAEGQDDVRIMSWNNGAMASATEEEFKASVRRARASYDAAFERQTDGVQPQECMFTPDHIGWYLDEGIEWITLFYAANGFTALHQDLKLEGRQRYTPGLLTDPQTGDQMVWVPVYHHADVLDHGGLAAWVEQISAREDRSSLLVIHFDADGESWENFGAELDALGPLLERGIASYTTIEGYLDNVSPNLEYPIYGDVADGTGDGFQSWAEKDFNHEIYTGIARARATAELARYLGGGDAGVEASLEAALEPRLLALSTTHFGLAAPTLHEDRMASARAFVDEANAAADEALALALDLTAAAPGEIRLHNPRASEGPALVEIPLSIPALEWRGADAVGLQDEVGAPIPAEVEVRDDSADPVEVTLRAVLEIEAESTRSLRWVNDPLAAWELGGASADDLPSDLPLLGAFTECAGERADAHLDDAGSAQVSERGHYASQTAASALALCDGEGALATTIAVWEGLPGAIIEIDAQMGIASAPDDAESVALSPIGCAGRAETVSWRTFAGTTRERPVRAGVESWNGQSVDGWLALGCDDGSAIQIAHRVPDRTSMAFAPLQDRGGQTFVAPLGTLWGATPWHDGRASGGSGIGDVITELVGSQFRPAAPDWSGAEIRYRLLVGEDLDEGALDLFAHPPQVEVGG